MSTSTASGPEPRAAAWSLCVCAALLAACAADEALPELRDDDPEEPICEPDELEGPESAGELSSDGPTDGYLCPVEDEDWFLLSVSADKPIVNVSLEMTNLRSPVEPIYAIWAQGDSGEADTVAAGPDPTSSGRVQGSHLLAPGEYFVAVRDQNDDAQDLRNRYQLSISAVPDPDGAEPNDELSEASPLGAMSETEAYIASAGDEDWYSVEVPAGSVIRIQLTMEMGGIQPKVSLRDASGEVIVEELNAAGSVQASDIEIVRVLAEAGTYYVVVSDDEGDEGEAALPYTLSVDVVQDLDTNEPNDHPRDATALSDSPIPCGADWSGYLEASGTVGSPGDNDWFELPLMGCLGAVLEAELVVGGSLSDSAAWELQQKVQASLTLVRSHDTSACDDDESCRTLDHPCEYDAAGGPAWQCEGFFNSCQSDGLCTGATVCLPNGSCGANQVQRHYTSTAVPSAPAGGPANEALLSAPILLDGTYYLRVSDWQSDFGDPEATYTLRVRVRTDPDPNDAKAKPNNLYSNSLMNEQVPVTESVHRYVAMQVEADCGTATWQQGSLSYENDMDFFSYAHPCPMGNCMLRLHYRSDAGEVEPGLFIYEGSNVFSSFPLDAGSSGTYGGIGSGANGCFFAYKDHSDYTVLIRDRADDERHWSADQSYEFCIEKVADGCMAPCMPFPDEVCNAP